MTRNYRLMRARRGVHLAIVLGMLLTAVSFTVAPPVDAAASDVWTIRRFDTQEKVMSLTFDAGADRGYTVQILDTLASNGIKASFGMTGVWAEQNPDLIQRIHNEGHHFINHSWNHPSFNGLTSAQRADQLTRTENLIRTQVGVDMRPYFRPPYGEYNDSVLADLAANGYTINVMWSTDSLGWNGLTATQITQRVVSQAVPGGIVLFHVGAQSQDAAALQPIINQLRAQGYRFQSIADFIEPGERHFPETGFTVSGNFLKYWNSFGGLPSFGYPISDVFMRDGKEMQYFERVRMELHPGVWPARYDVLLGRLGADLTAHRTNEAPFRRVSGGSNANCAYYEPTGHWLCFGFRDYWRAHGGLEIFGYPISEEFREGGYTVQYFERARFEYHPENQPPWDILGGHLGRTMMELER
ncbi:MAG TPA: polysaccharide deacetylase family protein [Thermomicrobiales bacterium]|nr:polysaccharide deacetylase family protein [Thermomicrobiales bacterium]